MGGGDLNMKKSWHPLLLKNQERVWLEEKKAVCNFLTSSLLIHSHTPLISSRRRRNLISSARKRKKNVNSRNYSDSKKNKPVKREQRN